MISEQPKVLVLGDLIIDEYIYGECTRISPEAPVPVVKFGKSVIKQGGAGNVVENLKALGAHVRFWGNAKSSHKLRIVAGHQQVVRLDRDDCAVLSPPRQETLREWVQWADVVLVSDYDKGVVNEDLLSTLSKVLQTVQRPLLVDPYNGKHHYGDKVTLIKPNRAEAESITGIKITDAKSLIAAGQLYLYKSGAVHCLITLGAEGMALFDRTNHWNEPFAVPPVNLQQVFDVTGAGDTAIAVLAYLWGSGVPDTARKHSAVAWANTAAAIACSKLGTAVVSQEELFVQRKDLQPAHQHHNSTGGTQCL
jgi:D-beta-D-heptose 7-phosphate kinase/D-beta-D-heptose 1-phosphate adenosyltransferase